MPTPLAIAVTAALLAACTVAARIGRFTAWPRADQIAYTVLTAAVWPWILVSFLGTPPWWYTALALSVAAAAIAVFYAGQVRSQRRLNRALTRLTDEIGRDPRRGPHREP